MSKAPPGWTPGYGSRPPVQARPQPGESYGGSPGYRSAPRPYDPPPRERAGPQSSGMPINQEKRSSDPEIQLRIYIPPTHSVDTRIVLEDIDRALPRLVYKNMCGVSPEDFPLLTSRDTQFNPVVYCTDEELSKWQENPTYIRLRGGELGGEYIFTAVPVKDLPKGHIYLSGLQRIWCGVTSARDTLNGKAHNPRASGREEEHLGLVKVEVSFAKYDKTDPSFTKEYDEKVVGHQFKTLFNKQILSPGQELLLTDELGIALRFKILSIKLSDIFGLNPNPAGQQENNTRNVRGILHEPTEIRITRAGPNMRFEPSEDGPSVNGILAPDFKFSDMGIGGLGNEFATIFRRAFASRVFPPGLVAKMGIPHVKGILLYGPPGTGKTLIARQIGQVLNAVPPKIINGPEVLNKYVGQSEENIRKLFADAEKEYKEKKDNSRLHIIIFDELDAVCKQRGSGAGGGTGVGDSVVNQLLSKLDGVDQLNNILLIGMTNRKDMIDDALMRPGRLEVHIEISLPDEPGRLEIFNIHTSKMRENNILDPNVDLEELAGITKNYSGAEINGVVKAAASFAFSRHTEVGQMAAVKQDVASMKVNRVDFMNALKEVRPAYGVSEAELEDAVRLGIIPYTQHINLTIQEMMRVVGMIKEDPNKFSTSVLFHGPRGAGKTALAAHIAMQSGFPFVKLVTPADLVGYRDDFAKKDYIHKAFTDAHKSPASILILDDFERLIGWNPIGSRFSNVMLEALTTLIISKPPRNHRLLVFVTTSKASVLNMLEIDGDFAKKVAVPAVSNLQELASFLREARVFSSGDIDKVVDMVQQRTGSDSIGVGIKTIQDCIFEAKAGGPESNVLETFAELLLEYIQETMM
ncbi:transport between ER and Golgi ATPase protein [Conoideocrella luteorostrata]|uniref:Vesicular-fusion protein SEC18 n=1 Tax=Conoideocrella luteorostrata TaxID=1105319 RepID=A0AAJ0CH08_9HYPO|nr:transport between ER and Golgi ATPase protein [Conoideocrella luteorostrata]